MNKTYVRLVRLCKNINYNNQYWNTYIEAMNIRRDVLWCLQTPTPTFSKYVEIDKHATHFIAMSPQEEVIGTISLHGNLIRQLAVKPSFCKKGVATTLVTNTIEYGIGPTIRVNSLLSCVGFYKKWALYPMVIHTCHKDKNVSQ